MIFYMIFLLICFHGQASESAESLIALQDDKLTLLSSYRHEASTLESELVSLSMPLESNSHIHDLLSLAVSETASKIQSSTRKLQEKSLLYGWLTQESCAHSPLYHNQIHHADVRIKKLLARSSQLLHKVSRSNHVCQSQLTIHQHSLHAVSDLLTHIAVFSTLLDSHSLLVFQKRQSILDSFHTKLQSFYSFPMPSTGRVRSHRLYPFSSFVPSPSDGVVTLTRHIPGLGFSVILSHHDVYTLIAGLSAPLVHENQVVFTGSPLGSLHDDAASVLVTSWS